MLAYIHGFTLLVWRKLWPKLKPSIDELKEKIGNTLREDGKEIGNTLVDDGTSLSWFNARQWSTWWILKENSRKLSRNWSR
jgi:hypothetical protein